MSIPSDIRPLVDELYQVLDDTDRQATKGLFALRRAMYEFSKKISHNTQITATKREESEQLDGLLFADN